MAIKRKNTKHKKHVFFKRSGDKKKVLKPRKKASSLLPDIDLERLGQTIELKTPEPAQELSSSRLQTHQDPSSNPPKDLEKEDLKRTIQQSVSRLSHMDDAKHTEVEHEAKVVPEEFNGVDTPEEKETLHNAEAVAYQKKAAKLAHEIEILKNEFESEKKHLQHTVRELKKELHRTAPIQDNKFFSLSRQLRSSLEEIETLVDPTIKPEDINKILLTHQSEQAPASPVLTPPETPVEMPPKTIQITHEQAPKDTPPPQTHIQAPDAKPKTKKHIEKKLLVTAIALLFVLSSGGIVSYNLIKKPEVDQALVDDFLQNQGQIQGATTGRTPKVDRYAEVAFDDSQWKNFNDPIYGIAFDYPENVVEKQKNGNGVAFLRKDGFLFKFQQIITPDTLEQYWNKNKDDGEIYTAVETKFRGRDAVSLSLKEKTDYSGNRYLVKVGDGILDIWYTTDDVHFNEDDIKRTKRIIDSINFLD